MTNQQAHGYVLLALKELNIDKESAEQIILAMEDSFDYYTEDEAEAEGFKWLYNK